MDREGDLVLAERILLERESAAGVGALERPPVAFRAEAPAARDRSRARAA